MVFEPLVKHTGWVSSVLPDGKRLTSWSGDKTVIIWDAEAGAVLNTPTLEYGVVSSLHALELASGSFLTTIRVWKLAQ
ncbi:hypothetical protein BDR05DRAFT_963077 [Suillus weaverae]|nr:hypothetical protein BDR05DRAFT_963077 [Suillus weaverae]